METFPVPKKSYPEIQSIIHAFYVEGTIIDSVVLAKGHDLAYASVSSNTNFLKYIGVLDGDKGKYILTPIGKKLGKAIHDNNDSELAKTWAAIIKDVDYFKKIMLYLERNSSVEYRRLKEQIIKITEIPSNKKSFDVITKVIIDIMEISGVIVVPRGRPRNWIVKFAKTIFGEPDEKYTYDLFILMPFSQGLNPIYHDHIKNVSNSLGLTVARADDFFSEQSIMNEIYSAIAQATIIVADCTNKNPNVFYEIGLAHAMGRPVILITQNPEDVPFDLKHIRYIQYAYTPPGMVKFESDLALTIKGVLEQSDSK
ncbi:MAG: hypothetical protein HY869_16275 [Chloroflexi bacterium]|nr:hypothetical protein [Chloroflexota bacterium]